MSLQNLIRRVLPKEESFYDLLEKIALLASSSVDAFRRLGQNGASPEDVAAAVQDIEHRADAVFHEVETGLARTFVTPMDREDIHQIAFEIDDVVDMVNLSARTCALFHMTSISAPMRSLMETLGSCTQALAEGMPLLRRHDYAGIIAAGRAVRALEKDADTVFRHAVSALFEDPAVDVKQLLKEKEILEHIEEAVDRCDRLANTLCNLAVKHG